MTKLVAASEPCGYETCPWLLVHAFVTDFLRIIMAFNSPVVLLALSTPQV
jgi:hypothetical protein